MGIGKNLANLLSRIEEGAALAGRNPDEIALVVVSKERTVEEIKEAYLAGARDFGENKVQEALRKMDLLMPDIRWHYVGKIQKNKINKIIGRFQLIHSVDTFEIASKISEASHASGYITNVLLEANTSGEKTKSGLFPDAWEEIFPRLLQLKGIEIHGFMTMAPLTEDEGVIRSTFRKLRLLRDRLQIAYKGKVDLSTLSMGMTHDFKIAIQEGATLLRIGTAVFTPPWI